MFRSPADITLFYDGACPFCAREVSWLKTKDRHQRIDFIDISQASFDAKAYGLDAVEIDRVLHGVTSTGEVLTAMEVTRYIYRLLGMGWLTGFTGWPGFRFLFDKAYMGFARNRKTLGRPWQRSCDTSCKTK